jgi:lysophospholipase L1-like esterase
VWRGWAAILAQALGATHRVNLAELGARSYTVAARQLPVALKLLRDEPAAPTVAAVIVGVNDTLRGSFKVSRTGVALHQVVRELRAIGAEVLTATMPDPGMMLRLPKSMATPLARRIRAVNAVTTELAGLYDTVHCDVSTLDGLYERRMWAVDRLHPSESGHRLLARAFSDLLAARGVLIGAPPAAEPEFTVPSRGRSVVWMATRGTKWVMKRSTDFVPALVGLTAEQWWHRMAGTVERIDQRLDEDLAQTLKALRHEYATTVPTPELC